MKRILSRQKIDEIVRMRKDGVKASEIAKSLGISKSTVYSHLTQELGLQGRERKVKKRKYTTDESFFEKIDTQEKAYTMGWFYSDGSNYLPRYTAKIDVAADSVDVLIKIREVIGSNARIVAMKNSANSYAGENAQTLYRLAIYNKTVSLQIAALGICGNMTYTRTWPEWLTEDLEPHFIRGLIDGDGCISISKKKGFTISYYGTKMMCEGLSEVLSKIGVEHRHKTDKKGHHFIRIMKQAECVKFADYIYNDATIYLNRKHDKYLEIKTIMKDKELKKSAQKSNALAMV